MGFVDLRLFTVHTRLAGSDQLVVSEISEPQGFQMEARLADVVSTNAFAVPARRRLRYRVARHELRMMLSFLDDQPGRSLMLGPLEDFKACARHVQGFVTESLGMGMLTAAVQSHHGWQSKERSLSNFDVLPTGLKSMYSNKGVRPDLLFDFGEEDDRWRLAGEARGRCKRRPQGGYSGEQRDRLDEIVGWSGRHELHPVAMTWAYSGSGRVQVDLFDIQQPDDANFRDEVEPLEAQADLTLATLQSNEEPVTATEVRALDRTATVTAQLYDSAPVPRERWTVADRHVRGDWVRADLFAPSDMHMLLAVLDAPLPVEQIRNIRGQHGGSHGLADDRPFQVAVLGRILVVVASGIAAPPAWSEVAAAIE